MTLDQYAAHGDDARFTRSGPLYDFANALIRHLGPRWRKDEDRAIGVRLSTDGISLDIEDMGHGMASVTCVMPGEFLPAPSIRPMFAEGAQSVAHEIMTTLLRRYLKITEDPRAHLDDETAWESKTVEFLKNLGTMIHTAPQIEVERDPGLHVSALFRKDTGDSLRADMAPNGGSTSVTVHVRDSQALESLVYAWHALERDTK